MDKQIFDCTRCGVGDFVVSAWIAQGAKETGHAVAYRENSHVDGLVDLFGLDRVAAEEGITFGGESLSYQYELGLQEQSQDRTHLWQFGLPWRVEPKRPKANFSDDEIKWAAAMRQEKTAEGKPLVILFPYANYNTRCWPMQKWLRLAWALEAEGVSTATLTSSTNEDVEAFPFYAYGFDMRKVAALVSMADVVVANDSGPAHLAGTLGTKTFAITGPTNPHTVFGYCPEIEAVATTQQRVSCVGCHFRQDKGFHSACDRGCEALHVLPVSQVKGRILAHLFSEARLAA